MPISKKTASRFFGTSSASSAMEALASTASGSGSSSSVVALTGSTFLVDRMSGGFARSFSGASLSSQVPRTSLHGREHKLLRCSSVTPWGSKSSSSEPSRSHCSRSCKEAPFDKAWASFASFVMVSSNVFKRP